MARALVLFSGGLDSLLAARLLQDLCDEVKAVCFTSPFFTSEDARMGASGLGVELLERDITPELERILRAPRHGFGRNMNPCIDCHTSMVTLAFSLLEKAGADFLATGEVLGERPMSQNRQSLEMVARESGAGGLLLRPLSARLLAPTVPETEGWVDREALMAIEGRSRKPQMELAEKWGITRFRNPAGGCLLTDPAFSARLKRMMEEWTGFDRDDLELLKLGRHFWVGRSLLALGRNDRENCELVRRALTTDHLFREEQRPGPVALLRTSPRESAPDGETLEAVAALLGRYGKGKAPLSTGEMGEVDPGDFDRFEIS